ncbi:MAG: ABC transporter ATP-binding protein [Microcystis aeruginosa LG13-12]|jgi:lipopolysaccharide transport system ATP-binding protein|nr:ABC transporter ATP-binding protein [Microcystis aeruginosa LG13-12]
MTDTIIEVENLGKRYVLDHQQEREKYTALRDVIAQGVKSALKGFGGKKTETKEEFWALKDVSFEVKRGEVVGIIGRNGAGKSTLLKILSRITEPTTGRVRLKGRVASLLEVGTGFHPELTGRENIYLNGAVLGMMRQEIDRKFDEIVAFAEVEKFLDTPVKRYSSGMYVRLAFAVAAHLEPEILVVDEVLAVGDAAFQKKCLGKMGDVASKEGRTVLFVSHNMAAVTQLCVKAIYLKHGKLNALGDASSVLTEYLNSLQTTKSKYRIDDNKHLNHKKVFFKEIEIINHEGLETIEFDIRYPFFIKLKYEVLENTPNLEITVRIDTKDGRTILSSHQSHCYQQHEKNTQKGTHLVYVKVPEMFLMPDSYLLTVGAHQPMVEMYDLHESLISFCIIETGSLFSRYGRDQHRGLIISNFQWNNSIDDLNKSLF